MSASSSTSSGLGLGTVLTIVFVVLKLVGTIHWSWWWVLSPLWLPLALIASVVGVLMTTAAIFGVVPSRHK